MAIAPVALRSQFSDLFGSGMLPVLEELFTMELEQAPMQREKLFKKVAHDRDIWQSSEIHDLDLFAQIAEGSEYSFKRAKQGANKTLTIKKMGLGFSITREAVEDGKFDLIQDMVKKLAKSAKESMEVDGMNILNNGFSSETTADGLSIFNAAHTLPSGTTFRNKLSADSDLSPSALDTMLQDFETQFVGDSGIFYHIRPKYLVVPPALRRYALEIVGSDLKADTADNNINSLKADGLEVVVSPRLTDSDAWFLTAAPEETGLRIIERTPLKTESDSVNGFVNDAIFYKASYREQLGCTHPYGVFGTPGA
jgi:hypothetical protein